MDTYVLLLDQITPFLESQSSEIPKDIQEKISLAGMGEETEGVYDGVEEFDYAVTEKNGKVLDGIGAKEIEDEGIRKGKGIRSKIKTEHYYIWDRLSPLQREYKVARHDFDHCPNHRENAASIKLAESITSYLETKFSDLPQQIKMNIAFVDNFLEWDEVSIKRRKYLAHEFDAKMQPDYEKEVDKFFDMYLELDDIPDLIFYWQRLNPNGIASEQIKIDNQIKEIRKRQAELNELLGYSNSNKKQESKQLQPKSTGRPRSVEKKVKILKQLIESLTAGEDISPANLPGSADNLLEACKRIAKAKSKKNMFSTSLSTFKEWLKATGYGFGIGRTPSDKATYWTNLCVKNIEKIPESIFTGDSGKGMPQPAAAKGIQKNET